MHGLVQRPLTLSLADLQGRTSVDVPFTIECSGNHGFGWNFGLIGNAIWTGTPLAALLQEAGPLPDGSESIEPWLAAGDYPLARRVNEMLVRAQENAAERTNAEYVDVFAATAGHDMCADDPWIAGIKPAGSDAMLYHPYPVEQQVVADLLVDLLD